MSLIAGDVLLRSALRRSVPMALCCSTAALLPHESVEPLNRQSVDRYRRQVADARTDRPRHVEPHLLYQPAHVRKSESDCHERLNVVLHGYDYATLERFQSYVHRLARRLDIDASEAWSVPPRTWYVVTYKRRSTNVRASYNIARYQRTVQLLDVESTRVPLLLNVLLANQPMGVQLTVRPHRAADSHERYIPDVELVLAQKELASFDDPAVRRKKHWVVE